MSKTRTVFVLTAFLLSACTSKPSATLTPEPTQAEPTIAPSPTTESTQAPTATQVLTATPAPTEAVSTVTAPAPIALPTPASHPGLPLPTDRGELFAGSGVCAVCHTNMVDAAEVDVSIDSFWRSTMMANASRDPYWQASFRAEVLQHPDYQATIEDKCTTCHTPMARFTASFNGNKGQAFEEGFFNQEHSLHAMALDGVSCTLCHQIRKDNFGQVESFGGGFVIDKELPSGERVTYGPFPVDEAQARIMQGASGFLPEQSKHIQQSGLCATCHTLYTPYFDAAGEIAGEFPEQTPYLEWFHSDYRETQACQGCHMPQAQGEVMLSITGGTPRSPFHQHVFVGGNTYVLSLLQQFGDELAATASSAQFGATIERLTDQLVNRTATVALEDVVLSDARLTANVVVKSQVGHKFPSAYPSRRVWLHLTVQDANGQVVFESGAPNADGSITHNDNDADPASFEPHHLVIDSPEQVQIYEAIMENSGGEVTTALLRGAGYVKDNRLLPLGFEAGMEEIAVRGRAAEDEDFEGGGDRIQYIVPLSNFQSPLTVRVELLYQSISYRWADNLRQYEATEINRFLSYQQAVPNLPIVVASVTVEVSD